MSDLCWLHQRGYTGNATLKLVGDRYQLRDRQRMAIMRCACSDHEAGLRRARCVPLDSLRGEDLAIDGYNVLTTLEAALAGGVLLLGVDGCLRDLAAMHGTWRRVEETLPALALLGSMLAELGPARILWLLDSPVSNSGRLRTAMQGVALHHGWSWEVELVHDPDAVLKKSAAVVATSDSVVLDHVQRWCNLSFEAVRRLVPSPWLIDLRPGTRGTGEDPPASRREAPRP